MYLYFTIYSSVITKSLPQPWPNPKLEKPVVHYQFKTRALPLFTKLHQEWYYQNDNKQFIKIVPTNIQDYFP
jgi:hypothetical protein